MNDDELKKRLDDALRGLIKLVDDGDLVRNTAGDHSAVEFMYQGVRIGKALSAAQEALKAGN